ncbi:hypothetical protein [Candidatus Enterococcus mangumiae]|uniref:Uncharacterized protein n=1 Tax=Candidatus Enterococcus mangumiae TaxID=2230878 RepID=A0ABZ2SWA5_9ENTE|nr:hypothetical protein [Enterococcus sp. DIV1094]MBO0489739.1 hypothetical protein [Enterococcus sp. DIV1094]
MKVSITETLEDYFKKQRIKKSDKLRMKNLKSGKDPAKGWDKMVDTGLGGLNSLDYRGKGSNLPISQIDNQKFRAEEQKRIGKETHK